ncbi:PREDICTED: uncharacterized protein LOC104777975 isoform X2 [Camelina sativa]|uniref:Uncharacterized protein LOC104777975 isoform X2 n=1 Tax=Camelina sativa TaxID=90675 RepID=A0ABM0YGP2_CAMSA|nr:PREDICTED: uncharacterized protein LOC104777975 isoform X2 [Camelina sativa]
MARALLLQPYRATIRAASSSETKYDGVPEVKLSDPTRNYRVLVLGGTGRVGGSTATALSKLCPKQLQIVVGGRNRDKGEAMVAKLGENSEFAQVDINDTKMLETTLRDVDLVVHAAGPFQQAPRCTVLEAAIKTKTAYVDVCDDTSYAFRAKSLQAEAIAANIPALTTAGIYPGVSNVMAAELVAAAISEDKGKPEKLRFSYYTAGTGGAGPTILATSFLLLGEEVTAYKQGEKVKLRPYSGVMNVDFGKGIRKRDVYLLNLPEVRSTHEVLGVPTVSARFGTAPFFWNWGMEIMTKVLPPEVLRDKAKVQQMVELFDPVVRALDGFAGERVSMRVDLECSDGRTTVGLFSHKSLSVFIDLLEFQPRLLS